MGTTVSLDVGWGFRIPEAWYSDDPGEDLWQTLLDYKTLEYGLPCFYDYAPEDPYYIKVKRLTNTFYDVDFHSIEAFQVAPILLDEEVEELARLTDDLGLDAEKVELIPFAAVRVG